MVGKGKGRHPQNALTAIKVRSIKKPGRYSDGGGLHLFVKPGGAKSWVLRLIIKGKRRDLGLGGADAVPLAEARELAAQFRKTAKAGGDPAAERRKAALSVPTFEQAAELYIAAHEASWRNRKHRAQWKSTLKTYGAPIAKLSVADVDTAHVLKCLKPVWMTKPETAGRLRGRIEKVLGWAKTSGYRQGENPARWKEHLDNLLPARGKVREVRHHPALPHAEMPEFMAALQEREGSSARALEVTILTALRTGSVIAAKWFEFDLASRTWTVPKERMKWKPGQVPRDHRVPLCDRAVEILKALPREDGSDYVFLGSKPRHHLSDQAMLELLRGMRPGMTVHGFRSTFKDWASETTGFPEMVVEMALAHTISDKVEAAYRRGDLFEKRRALMDAWAGFATGSVGTVVTLSDRKRL